MAAGAGSTGTRSMEARQGIPSKQRTRIALPKHPRGFEHHLASIRAGGRMWFYLNSASSAERPSPYQIRDPISSTLRNSGQGTTPPEHPLRRPNFAPFPPNSYPSSPARGGYAVPLATGDAAPRSIFGCSWGGRPPGHRPGHRTTHRDFPEAPILKSPAPPPPPPRGPRLAPRSVRAPPPFRPPTPCALRRGKTPPGASLPGRPPDLCARRRPRAPTHSPAPAGAAILALARDPHPPPGSVAAAAAAAAAGARSGGYVSGDAAPAPPPRRRRAGVWRGRPARGCRGAVPREPRRGCHSAAAVDVPGAAGARGGRGSFRPAACSAPVVTVAVTASLWDANHPARAMPSALNFCDSRGAELFGRKARQFGYLQNLPKGTGVDLFRGNVSFPRRHLGASSRASSDSSRASKVPE